MMPEVAPEAQPILDVPLQLVESESPTQVGSFWGADAPRPLLIAGMPSGHSLSKN